MQTSNHKEQVREVSSRKVNVSKVTDVLSNASWSAALRSWKSCQLQELKANTFDIKHSQTAIFHSIVKCWSLIEGRALRPRVKPISSAKRVFQTLAVNHHLLRTVVRRFSVIFRGSSVNTGGCVIQTLPRDARNYITLFPTVMMLLCPWIFLWLSLCRFEIWWNIEVSYNYKIQLADFCSPADLILNYWTLVKTRSWN